MEISSVKRRVFLFATLLCAVPSAMAVLPSAREPIALEADSSEFDRESGTLMFQNVHIRQGTLNIVADTAKADDLDFANSAWDFSGHVKIDGEASRILADTAVLRFRDHRLVQASVDGQPATFAREKTEEFRALNGSAETIDYDVASGVLTLKGNATLLDGTNEISGATLRYELGSQKLVASSEQGGDSRVRITVTPQTLGLEEPEGKTEDDSASPKPDSGQ